MTRSHFFRNFLAATSFAVAALALPVRADLLELTNGDHYRGTIVSMSASNVEFQSEVQGRVTLPRNKIATITLHEVVAKPIVVTKPAAPTPGVAAVAPDGNTNATSKASTAPAGMQANAVIEQLRKQGVQPKLIEQVQEQIFGKASPEAAGKFNELMGGLMTGRLSMQDIRAQAQGAINQIHAAKKELGGDAGDMLDSYLGVLEKFMQESTGDGGAPAAKAAPGK